MKKLLSRLSSALVAVMFVFTILAPTVSALAPADTILIDSTEYDTLQEAVDAADPGDTIEVGAGTYVGQVNVDKAITLEGANAGTSGTSFTRGAESVISAPGLFAFNVTASGVTIDGFTISGAMGVYSETGSSTTDMTVQNNIITGTSRGVSLGAVGTDTSVIDNKFLSTARSLHISGGPYTNLVVSGNTFQGSIQTLLNIDIAGFDFTGNTLQGAANIASNITNGDVSGNTFNATGGTLNLQITLRNSTLTDNVFNGASTTACLQIFGTQNGIVVPSHDVLISGNQFLNCGVGGSFWTYAIQLSQEIHDITISDNVITNAYQAVNTRIGDGWTLAGKDIVIEDNQITGSRNAAVSNTVSGTLVATGNWWGNLMGPGEFANVDTSGWCTNSACTSFHSEDDEAVVVTDPEVDFSDSVEDGVVELPSGSDLQITTSTSGGDLTVVLAEGTTITATDAAWDGIISAPTVISTPTITITPPTGFDSEISIAIEVGSSDTTLTFDKAARLTLPGQTGKKAGFVSSGTTIFEAIDEVCDADNQAAVDAQFASDGINECAITVGSDLIVWTNHFTTFLAYTLVAEESEAADDDTTADTNDPVPAATTGDTDDDDAEVAGERADTSSTSTDRPTGVAGPAAITYDVSNMKWWYWALGGLTAFAVIYYIARSRIDAKISK